MELFHPLIREWFRERIGSPTAVQEQAWPRIAAGEHVLVTAPTGSGKTLTAFLWGLDRLLTGAWAPGAVRLLYISPLKALNSDIRHNLERPLAELNERFQAAGLEVPAVRAMTRSGDTPQEERRRMVRQPPEILITTPESLNILLTSENGRKLFDGIASVILDEVHAVAPTKRGTHLITAVDRLVPLAGDFQRVALSATVRPLERIAHWVGGYEQVGGFEHTGGGYRQRRVEIVRGTAEKRYDVRVCVPNEASPTPRPEESETDPGGMDSESRWDQLGKAFRAVIKGNNSTLFFANSRRMTEKVTRVINGGERRDLAYSHHGSLSREVRGVVEQRLKDGELPAIVATSSLELGIDVGALDEVVLVSTPPTVSSSIQRVGRAGHGVGEVSRARIYPIYPRDFLNAGLVARAIRDQDIEEIRPLKAPLDVLAQVILSMTAGETWEVDRLFDFLRTSAPFHDLRRRHLDLVLEMLAGRYADSRIRELKARVVIDRVQGTVRGRAGNARLIYMSGGTIPDRGYYSLRLEGSMAKIGELDEEFVWERSLGDTFTLGAQVWQIRKVTHNDVVVVPGRRGSMAPFWRAEPLDRDFHFAEKGALFLGRAEERLEEEAFAAEVAEELCMEPAAVDEILRLLRLQRSATGVLPHRRRLLVEHVEAPADAPAGERRRLILHTLWGGRVNRPLAMALAAAWEERYDERIEVVLDDDAILLMLPRPVSGEEVLAMVPPEHVEELLRKRLEKTGFFGARFRMNASTALLLPRSGFRHRTPLWLNRRRSKKLLDSVTRYGDFPILLETWRTCLQDDLDVENLRLLLGEVAEEKIIVHEARTTAPSPFASELGWQLTNQYMYDDDSPDREGGSGSKLRSDLLQELVFSSQLRPRLPVALVERFRGKVRRTSSGYTPRDVEELELWIDERVLLPEDEWRELIQRMQADLDLDEKALLAALGDRVEWVTPEGAALASLVVRDRLRKLEESQQLERRVELVGEWLRFEGPVVPQRLRDVFGLSDESLRDVLETLRDARTIVFEELTSGAQEPEVCDVENLEILLRWLRLDRRATFETLPADRLPLFLAHHQGVAQRGDGVDDLQDCLERLLGYNAPASLWESELLPARLAPYYPQWLDSLMQESDLTWLGCGKERLTFIFPIDFELLGDGSAGDRFPAESETESLLAPGRRATLSELSAEKGLGTAELTAEIWDQAWQGRLTNDTFVAVRKGIENKWKAHDLAPPTPSRRRPRRGQRDRWQASRLFWGHWYAPDPAVGERDALEEEELRKDRVRLLLQRYGILFRELLEKELPTLRWGQLFRSLRLMELSGEVVSGRFFDGVRGLQFVSQATLKELRRGLTENVIFFLNAADPASLCGVDVEGVKEELPSRLSTTHLVYDGRRVVLISKKRGKDLEFRVGADHPNFREYVGVLKMLLTREHQPLRSIEVETINGEPASQSPYAVALGEIFRVVREQHKLKLWKSY